MQPRVRRRRDTGRLIAVAATTAIILLAACSGSDGADGASDPDGGSVTAAPAEDEVFTEHDDVTVTDEEGRPDDAIDAVVESLPAVAETGVPGIDSEDRFCRAWSTYAGTVQAISLAWALQPPGDAARLEVAATAALSQAVADMSAELPEAIESNRQALTVDVPGPFLRRADRGRTLLVDAGLGDDQIVALGASWVEAITEQGLDTDSLTVDVPADSVEALDSASQAFAAELPSVLEDPTLDTTEFDISPSLAYISDTCPDQGTLAGNDEVDSGGA